MRFPVQARDEGNIVEREAESLVRLAIDRGVNYFDTAYSYHRGNSERFLGKVLQGGLRKKVFLSSKLPSLAIATREDCDRYLNEQLERLRTDTIDFYLLHGLKVEWWNKLLKADVLDFLDSAIRDGRIRFAGFSFHDELDVFQEIVPSYDWSFCMLQFNYMDENRQAGTEGLKYAASKGLGIAVMEGLRGGRLATRAPKAVQRFWDHAQSGRSPAEWGLRWVWNHPEVSVVLSGMNTKAQIEENCRVAEEALPGSLSSDELELIERVRDLYRSRIPIPCTNCRYCLPCPEGVNIPRIFSIYNDRAMYEDFRGAGNMYRMAMSCFEWASNCSGCGRCEELCPQQINIREWLEKCHAELIDE
jgi:predicted aldo/keto reductase-like oxidoreductase